MWTAKVKSLTYDQAKEDAAKAQKDIKIVNNSLILNMYMYVGSRDGAVVRVLVSHQRVPGSIPGLGIICGLSLLLVLFSAPRGFSPATPVFPSPQKPTFPNSNSRLEKCPQFLNIFLTLK